ncbi:MAG: DUF1629 domain-containing protein [Galbitalea sp.]
MVVGHADLLPGPNFVVSDRAREVLEDVVRDDGEFLPLSCEEEPLWLLSITRVIDALDPERSSLEGNEWSKYVVRHWFREELLRDVSAFCLPREKLVGGAYVTDRFVAAATEHHLVGRDFRLLWEAAATPKRFANQAREGGNGELSGQDHQESAPAQERRNALSPATTAFLFGGSQQRRTPSGATTGASAASPRFSNRLDYVVALADQYSQEHSHGPWVSSGAILVALLDQLGGAARASAGCHWGRLRRGVGSRVRIRTAGFRRSTGRRGTASHR